MHEWVGITVTITTAHLGGGEGSSMHVCTSKLLRYHFLTEMILAMNNTFSCWKTSLPYGTMSEGKKEKKKLAVLKLIVPW